MDGMIFRWSRDVLECEDFGPVISGALKGQDFTFWCEYIPRVDRGVFVLETQGTGLRFRGTGYGIEERLKEEMDLNVHCGKVESDWENDSFWEGERDRCKIAGAFFQRIAVE